jgi:hypothetical protein
MVLSQRTFEEIWTKARGRLNKCPTALKAKSKNREENKKKKRETGEEKDK